MAYCGDKQGKDKIQQMYTLLETVEQLPTLPRDMRENIRKLLVSTSINPMCGWPNCGGDHK